MGASAEQPDPHRMAQELLQASGKAELRLLKQERKAERRLTKAREALAEDLSRLQHLQEKVTKSQAAVAAAEEAVRAAHASRAAGPPSSA